MNKYLILVVMAILLSSNVVVAAERVSASVTVYFETEETAKVRGLMEHYLKKAGMAIKTDGTYSIGGIVDDITINCQDRWRIKIVFIAGFICKDGRVISVFRNSFSKENMGRGVKDVVNNIIGIIEAEEKRDA